ncbi:MAG: DUF3592 domain-containing protein [Gammaproteobacteria bacterium]
MRLAAFWMFFTAIFILAYVWLDDELYMPKPEPWATHSGTILSNTIQAIETEAGQQFKVDLVYQYQSQDSVKQGKRIRPAEVTYPSRERAEAAAKAFPVGKEVKVYVNPVENSKPEAVLVWEFPNILSPVVFIIIIMIGISVVLYLISEYQKFNK